MPGLLGRGVLPSFICALALMSCASAFGQGAKVTALSEPIREEDRDHPRERERWFMRGRTVLGQSAAALRHKAHQQKMRMRAARAAAMRAQNAPVPASSSSAGWIPLGPAPLASDASGSGIQDYGLVSGRATSVAIDPADSTGNTVFVGGAYGGVWKSTNAGPLNPNPANVTWTPVIDNQASLAVGAIAIQPGNTNPANSVLLVGTGEANSSGDSYYGVGILRSTDGGSTWNLISSADAGTHPFLGLGFTKIAFSTLNPNLVVAASAASSVGVENGAIASSIRGLYTSIDGGTTWTLDNLGVSPAASATAVVFNPNPAPNGSFFAAIRYHGFYSSPDGVTWTRLANQPGTNLTAANCPATLAPTPTCPIYRGEFAVVPGRNEMYAWYVDVNENDQGIWQSKNGGTSWTQISNSGITNCGDPGNAGCTTQQGTYNLEMSAVPSASGTDLYAGAINIFKCSINGSNPTCANSPFLNLTHVYGCSSIAKVHPDQHAVAFAFPLPSGKALMYFANDGGIYRALDGFNLTTGTCGGSNPFDSLNQTLGSMTQFVAFSQHPSDANTILGGTQDNGSPASSQATTNPSWLNVNGGDGGYNAITPSSPGDWFVSNPDLPPGGLEIDHCSLGINCHTTDFFNGAVVTSSQLGADDGDFYFPYILDPQADHELLVGTCRVWRGGPSTSRTGVYTALGNNFEVGGVSACTGGEINLVRSLAAGGPKDSTNHFSNVVYATTAGTGGALSPAAGGEVWVTTNAAAATSATPATFTNVTGSINPRHFPISSVAIDPSDASGNTAYVTIMGFHVSHVWKTTNAGGAWTDSTGTLPDAPANSVIVDAASGTVYVGTDVGVFSSSTSAANWTEVGPVAAPGASGFLPNVPVTALKIFNSAGLKILRASTYGRGIWQSVLSPYAITVDTPQPIFPGQTTTFNGLVTSFSGYNSAVTLSCTAGASSPPPICTVIPNPVTPSSTGTSFMVTAGNSATVQDYFFNLHGVGADPGQTTQDVGVKLRVVDFSLAPPNPSSVDVDPTIVSQSIQLVITPLGSFDDTVTLSCSGLPAGSSCAFSPTAAPTVDYLAGAATVNMTINAPTATAGTQVPVIISANSAGAPAAKTQTLTVNFKSPGYTMAISNPNLQTLDGAEATYNGTLTTTDGYSIPVAISCVASNSPGSTVPPRSCGPTSATPSLSGTPFSAVASSNSAGTFNFNIQGTGTFSQSIAVRLTVAQNFTLTSSTSSQTVSAGKPATYNLSVAPQGLAFDNPISFSCAGLPSLSQCAFNPPSVTPGRNAQAVVLTIGTTAPVALLMRGGPAYAAFLALPGIGFVFAGLIGGELRRKRIAKCVALGLVSLILLLAASCGGGSGTSSGPPTVTPKPGTPPGTYQVTVTASSGALSQQQVVTLTVQ